MCVILDTYNNNTRIPIVKTRITHNGGSKVLSRRKQTNKKIKKRQKDVWHGSSMKCEVRHATAFSFFLTILLISLSTWLSTSFLVAFAFFFQPLHNLKVFIIPFLLGSSNIRVDIQQPIQKASKIRADIIALSPLLFCK